MYVVAGPGAHGADFVWVEGESLATRSFAEPAGFRPDNDQERDVLSGGDWLAFPSRTESVTVQYPLTIPAGGRWNVWVRGHGLASAGISKPEQVRPSGVFRWRLDNGEWRDFGSAAYAVDVQALDITTDRYYVASWHLLGDIAVEAGDRMLRIEAVPGGAFSIDCFCLTRDDFFPHGKCRPGETFGRADEGWFSFEPYNDPFAPSPLDMLSTLDAPSGKKGVVVRKGDRLVFAQTGEDVRFWGVTACPDVWHVPRHYMRRLARELAKRGVNLVRLHAAPFYESSPGTSTEGIHYFCAQLKENGIYYGFNWFCTAVSCCQEGWGWPGFAAGDHLLQLQFYYPPFIEKYRQWARTLLDTPNPHTGMSLARDPSTAYVELIDEDSLFWWAFDPAKSVKPQALPVLEKKWADWCVTKHGSLDAALAAWGAANPPAQPDLAGDGRLALYPAGFLTGQPWAKEKRNPKRAADQARFMFETMRGFYTQTADWLRRDLGYRGLVLSTNWKTADDRVLGPLEKHADCALDLTAINAYFGCSCENSRFFPCTVGMLFRDRSMLRSPEGVATFSQIGHNDHPQFFTEGSFVMPNRYRAEEQLLQACYASLQGLDGIMPFVCQPDWNTTILTPWPIQSAVAMGQYPAMSLIYRKGYVTEAPPVAKETIALEDLFQLKGSPLGFAAQDDGNQGWAIPKDQPAVRVSAPTIDPLAFYVGRLTRQIGDAPTTHTINPDLHKYIDRKAKTVRSITGQIEMDYVRGWLKLDAPKAQGAAGFLGACGPIQTTQAMFDIKNEYAATVLVSLDDKPIEASESLLLQIVTEESQFGRRIERVQHRFSYETSPGETSRLARLGSGPVQVKNIQGSFALKRADAASLHVAALDARGYPLGVMGNAKLVTLRPDAIYYHITTEVKK